jgi:DNA-binding protein WhiA
MGIIAQSVKTSCCKRALLQGVLAVRGQVYNNDVLLSVDSADTADFIKGLVWDVYSKEATEVVLSTGGRRKTLSFNAKSVTKYLSELSEVGISYPEKCQMCQSFFLRGIFLAAGRVSDPIKQYSLEFSVGTRAGMLADFFRGLGLDPKISEKKNETVVYFRNSSLLEDFFALANMNQTAFEVMNAKIEGELRNTANRIANCETNNIDRAISASMSQITLIEELIERGLISLLPDELERTARFRMENKDMSLSQLAGAITPPISKSGLSHRLKKITEMAENILKGNLDSI